MFTQLYKYNYCVLTQFNAILYYRYFNGFILHQETPDEMCSGIAREHYAKPAI